MALFGHTQDKSPVFLYTLQTEDLEVGLINYGATIIFLKCKGKDGTMDDITAGFDDMEGNHMKTNTIKILKFCF